MRTALGLKVAFVTSEEYFKSMYSASMVSTAKATGADVVLLLKEGHTEDSLSDEELEALILHMLDAREQEDADDAG